MCECLNHDRNVFGSVSTPVAVIVPLQKRLLHFLLANTDDVRYIGVLTLENVGPEIRISLRRNPVLGIYTHMSVILKTEHYVCTIVNIRQGGGTESIREMGAIITTAGV